jgi:hypothetical protein
MRRNCWLADIPLLDYDPNALQIASAPSFVPRCSVRRVGGHKYISLIFPSVRLRPMNTPADIQSRCLPSCPTPSESLDEHH